MQKNYNRNIKTIIMDFFEKYTSSTDEQILEILRKRKDYQDTAVDAAVKIAIERQLIHSAQDLFSPEFQNVKPNQSILFPEISNDFQRQKLEGSIFRFLYVMSILPLVFGFLKYAEGQIYLTAIGVGIGLIWFLLNFLLFKTHKKLIFIPLFLLLFTISFGIGWNLIHGDSFHFLDLIMLLIGTILPGYLLLFLSRLIQPKSKIE